MAGLSADEAQLVLTGSPAADTRSRRDLRVMVLCAAGATASIKAPELFGMRLDDDASASFYGPNVSLFALPWLAGFLAWRRQAQRPLIGILVALFVLGAVAANAYPLADTSQSVVVTSIHLPIALWLVVGLAYVADDWRSSRRCMDFIRFTGGRHGLDHGTNLPHRQPLRALPPDATDPPPTTICRCHALTARMTA